jgi:hypothetical protein
VVKEHIYYITGMMCGVVVVGNLVATVQAIDYIIRQDIRLWNRITRQQEGIGEQCNCVEYYTEVGALELGR